MRYCIGCEHFDYDAGELDEMGSSWTGPYGGRELFIGCRREHWQVKEHETTREEFGAMMETANNCEDWSERIK